MSRPVTAVSAVRAATAAALAGGVPAFAMNDEEHAGRYDLGAAVDMQVESMCPSTGAARTHMRAGTATAGGRRTAASGSTRLPTAPGTSAAYPIVVITENRAREVGIAHVNLASMHTIELIQIADNQSFTQTLALLHLLAPVEIVISRSQVDRLLFQKIIQYWGSDANPLRTQISAINRKFFDEVRGETTAHALSCRPVQPDVLAKYLALASLAALTKYVENMQRIHFAEKAMNIISRESTGRMSIDYESLKSLEVLRNAQTHNVKDSLLGVMDRTSTAVGSRLLRAQLISPVNDAATLETRLDCVGEILQSEKVYFAAQNVLKKLVDLDSLLTAFAYTPKVATPRTARHNIHSVLMLKHSLELMPRLAEALAELKNPLLAAVRGNLEAAILTDLRAAIIEIIDEDAAFSTSSTVMRQQECFAVRMGVDGTLDAMRKVYTDCIQEINELVENYKKTWNMPALRLVYNVSRGYHLVLPANVETLPSELIQAVKNKSSIACSTDQLSSLNDRLKESVFNIYVITNVIIGELMNVIRQHMHPLFKMTESVAMLDMLLSFASTVVTSPHPELYSASRSLAERVHRLRFRIKGRHPIAEHLTQVPFVPNDIYLSRDANMLLLTGPNCSGKSTYLKQAALLVLLAHIGCYIPATSASIRLTDRICTRMGMSDDMEANASTFLKEMKEAAFILEQVNPESAPRLRVPATGTTGSRRVPSAARGERVLVVLDELGRGTANEDGVGVAWSICEYLLTTHAYTVVATHYHELGELTAIYPNARAYSMTVEATADVSKLDFKYVIAEGSSPHRSDYGIQLAEMAGLPRVLVSDARTIKTALAAKLAPRPMTAAATWAQARVQTAGTARHERDDTVSVAFGAEAAELVLAVAQKRMIADIVARLEPAGKPKYRDAATMARVQALVLAVYKDYILQMTALGIPRLCGGPPADPGVTPQQTASAPGTSDPGASMRTAPPTHDRGVDGLPSPSRSPSLPDASPIRSRLFPAEESAAVPSVPQPSWILSAARAPRQTEADRHAREPCDSSDHRTAPSPIREPNARAGPSSLPPAQTAGIVSIAASEQPVAQVILDQGQHHSAFSQPCATHIGDHSVLASVGNTGDAGHAGDPGDSTTELSGELRPQPPAALAAGTGDGSWLQALEGLF